MDSIDKIFIINLDEDIDRLTNSYNQLNHYNINNYERYPAINGRKANKYELNSYTTNIGKIIASKSMIGCGISHINIWKKIVKEKINKSLIVEDDFIFVDDFLNKFNNIFDNNENNDYEMLFLSSAQLHNKYFKIRNINEYLYKQLFISQTVGYIITLEGAEKILKYINKVSYHIDIEICIISLITDLNIISVKEPLIYQTLDSSNNTHERNYPLIVDKLLTNKTLNYCYKVVRLSINGFDININILLIFILGFYLFEYAILLLLFEYLYKPNDKLIGNLAILSIGYLLGLIKNLFKEI